jgi:hypothetical protein
LVQTKGSALSLYVVRFDSGSVGAVAPRETANEQRYSRPAARLRPSLLEIGVTALSASSQQKANLLTRPLH